MAGCAEFADMAGQERAAARPDDRDAEAVDPAAREIDLAVRYMDGNGVPRDPVRAVALLRPHAEGGSPKAQLLLGLAYASGQGVDQDTGVAAGWYEKAAIQDQPEAQYLLGLALLRGRGLPKI